MISWPYLWGFGFHGPLKYPFDISNIAVVAGIVWLQRPIVVCLSIENRDPQGNYHIPRGQKRESSSKAPCSHEDTFLILIFQFFIYNFPL